jgi:pilZ domain
MMQIDKNILSFLQIKSIYIEYEGSTLPCMPIEMNKTFMRVLFFDKIPSQHVTIKFLTDENIFVAVKAVIKNLNVDNQYAVFFVERLPHLLQAKLLQLETEKNFSDKRSGKRYKITKTNYKDLKLESNLITVVICGEEFTAELQDISIHGLRFSIDLPAKIKENFLQNGAASSIGAKFIFAEPKSIIFLILTVMHFSINENQFSIGCQIKQPYNLEYTNRIIKFLTEQEANYVLEQQR